MTIRRAKDPSHLSGPAVREVRRSYVEDQYPTLVRNNRLRASDLTRLRDAASNFEYKPLVSVLIPILEPKNGRLKRALDSMLKQVYPGWELCVCADGRSGERVRDILSFYGRLDGRVRVAYPEQDADVARLSNAALSLSTGDFVGLLHQDDELAPDALFEVVGVLQEYPECDLIYSDEDTMDEGRRSEPHFKPDWSPDLLLSNNYVADLSVYRRSLLEEVGGFREGFEGSQDYDLVLRATERAGSIRHVPKVLYHKRASTGPPTSADGDGSRVQDGARRSLSEALQRRGIEGTVENGILRDDLRVRMRIQGEPKVSVIVPTRDNVSMLKNCVESIERLTNYRNYEIIIIDNDSVDRATVEYLASTPHRVIPFREEFNYSRINNLGVSLAEGEYVLLLNDDTEVISGEWLEAMLQHAQRPETGAVGAKLVYPDSRIQHAGVLIGVGGSWGPGVATHSHQYYPSTSPGYLGTVARTTNYSAVTAACVLLRKSVFEEVGGFDEENLRVSFNDVDLCLRIRERGYSIVYTPYAELYHYESLSRGYKGDPAEVLYMRERWGEALDADPFYNPNFSTGSGDFNLRADLLRPRILRPTTGSSRGDSESLKNALTTGQDELLEYIKIQQRSARNSRRTALAPGGRDKGRKIPPKEEPDHDGQPGSVSPGPANARGAKGAGGSEALREEQLIWIFGSPRTGSTWLSRMMAEFDNQERWHEPYVGLLFGSFVYERLGENKKLLGNPSFIMGEAHRKVWLNSIKNFVVDGALARYPRLRRDQYLVVKEPNGSVGAPLLLEATPESRMIFLIRDPRDVVASRLDALREGSWSAQDRNLDTAEKLNAFTRQLAEDYFKVVSQVQKAYDAHPGKKTLVRYEDLRYDTAGILATMYRALGVGFDGARLEAVVAKHSWEQIPSDDKGAGKFYRKAQPGSWRGDLSPEQISIVEEITGPVLRRFYGPGAADQTFSG